MSCSGTAVWVWMWSIYKALLCCGLMKLLPDTLLQGFFLTECRFVKLYRGEDSLMCYCAEFNVFGGSGAERVWSLNVRIQSSLTRVFFGGKEIIFSLFLQFVSTAKSASITSFHWAQSIKQSFPPRRARHRTMHIYKIKKRQSVLSEDLVLYPHQFRQADTV